MCYIAKSRKYIHIHAPPFLQMEKHLPFNSPLGVPGVWKWGWIGNLENSKSLIWTAVGVYLHKTQNFNPETLPHSSASNFRKFEWEGKSSSARLFSAVEMACTAWCWDRAIYQNCISFSSLSNLKIYVDLLSFDTQLRPSYGILRQKGKAVCELKWSGVAYKYK